MNSKKRGFYPTQVIFSTTNACNLHCAHCFVNRKEEKLPVKDALAFLQKCADSGQISHVGFTGGEPFLYMEFLLELTKATIAHDLLFDQIMTNGDWWQDQQDLENKLQALYKAGYDGKIGLSWDLYHGQDPQRMQTFIKSVQSIFGSQSINIQTVISQEKGGVSLPLARSTLLATPSNGGDPRNAPQDIPVYTLPRTYPSEDPQAWQASHWFKEDYCQGPGNILYVHSNGNIAPCCGFANENPALFIGHISDSFETIIKNAGENKMVQLCFYQGLSHYRKHDFKKKMSSMGQKIPGRTKDICSFCDFVCKMASI